MTGVPNILYTKKISKKNINAIFCIIDSSLFILPFYYGNQYISLSKLIRNKFSQYEIRKKKIKNSEFLPCLMGKD